MLIRVNGRTHFNHYPNYPDCACGRSSRWYDGITQLPDKKFTCIFCLSNIGEGGDEAIALYGTWSAEHIFYEEQTNPSAGNKKAKMDLYFPYGGTDYKKT